MNTKGSVYAGNASASRILGQSFDTIQDSFFSPIILDRFDDPDKLRQLLDQTNSNQLSTSPIQLHYAHPEGQTLTLAVSVSLLEQYGKIFGVLIQFDDVTEIVSLHEREKQMLQEKSLLQMQRIESLNSFSMAIAHQIRNPMMTISGFAKLLLKKRQENERDAAWLEAIMEGAGRLETIVTAVSEFNALSFQGKRAVSLHEIISETRSALKKTHFEKINAISFELLVTKQTLVSDPHLLKVAVYEVLLNAIEALESQRDDERKHIVLRSNPIENGVILEITDTGCGIHSESLPFLFDPFFTTKAVGVGMGLCKAKRALHELGGDLTLENEPLEGVKATLVLHNCLSDPCKNTITKSSSHSER